MHVKELVVWGYLKRQFLSGARTFSRSCGWVISNCLRSNKIQRDFRKNKNMAQTVLKMN